jgi:hypothetical protein
VDGIEAEHAGRMRVIRLNVQDPAGKILGKELGFRLTPTFVLFDDDGIEVWRSIGAIDAQQIRDALGA